MVGGVVVVADNSSLPSRHPYAYASLSDMKRIHRLQSEEDIDDQRVGGAPSPLP